MKNEIGACDARTRLPEILRRVESGEVFTITKRGKPIADLTPSRSSSRMNTETAIRNILGAQKQAITDETLQDLKQAGSAFTLRKASFKGKGLRPDYRRPVNDDFECF